MFERCGLRMGVGLWLALGAFSAVLCSAEPDHVGDSGSVTLRDRQVIQGTLQSPDEKQTLLWKGDGFLDPFEFPFDSIKKVEWHSGPTESKQETFAFELVDGDLITGDLISADAKEWIIESEHLGEFRIPFLQLSRVTRLLNNPTLVYPHLSGLQDWTSPAWNNEGWMEDGTELFSKQPDSTLLGDLDVPERAIIEFELSWEGTPNFHLELGCDPGASPDQASGWAVTCIGKTLAVFRERAQTADLDILAMLEDDSSIRLTAFLDQKRDAISIFGTDGALLGQLNGESDEPNDQVKNGGTGVLLTNRDGSTRLQRLRIAKWIGGAPKDGDETSLVTMVTTDSSTSQGGHVEFEVGSEDLHLIQGDQSIKIALEELAAISLQPREQIANKKAEKDTESTESSDEKERETSQDAKPSPDSSETESANTEAQPKAGQVPASIQATMLLHGGARLTGKLSSIGNQKIQMDHASTAQHITVEQSAVRLIVWRAASWLQAPSATQRLTMGESSMVGQLVPTETEEAAGLSSLRWAPIRSKQPARFQPNASARIQIPVPTRAKKEDTNRSAQLERQAEAMQRIRDRIKRLREEANRKVEDARAQAIQEAQEVMERPAHPEGQVASKQDPEVHEEPIPEDPISYDCNLYLRSGDQFACQIIGAAEQGVLLKPKQGKQQIVSHDQIKAIELTSSFRKIRIEDAKRRRLLTLPRLQKDSPPTHMLVAINGDMLRCRMLGMDGEKIRIEMRLEEVSLPRDRISRIIWLHPETLVQKSKTTDDGDEASDPDPEDKIDLFQESIQAVMRKDGSRLTFRPGGIQGSSITGVHEVFGPCKVALEDVDRFLFGPAILSTEQKGAYQEWVLTPAREPVVAAAIRGDMPQQSHPLQGERAPEVNLPLLDGDRFRLSRHRGQIVVLDFWASWCAPCMQTMPKVEDLMSNFDPNQVMLVTINVSDGDDQIRRSLKRLNIRPEVALDIDGVVSQRYQANAIPQLVVIDKQGMIRTVFVGGGDVMIKRLRETLTGMLAN